MLNNAALKKLIYYPARLMSKTELQIIGRTASRFGKLKKNYIVFKNRTMQDMTDNPRAFCEYLTSHEKYAKYKIIWMVSDKKKFRKKEYKNIKFVTAENRYGWTSPLAYYYGAVAGHFFYTNNTAYLNLYHCKGQVTVNMWHGCGYKDAAKESRDNSGKKSMMHFDCALVPGPVFTETKARYWNCEKSRIIPLGYPRYDWMLYPSTGRKEIIRKLFGMNDRKMILWMPTFRQSGVLDSAENAIQLPFPLPGVYNEGELRELDDHLNKRDILLVIKKHPVQSAWNLDEKRYRNIRFVTQDMLDREQIQLYELISAGDGLISDYSSVAVDYMLLDRPLAYVLVDLEEYKKTRGFVFENPLEYMPGEKICDLKGFKEFTDHIQENKDTFREERHRLLPVMHSMPVKDSYCRELAEYLKL